MTVQQIARRNWEQIRVGATLSRGRRNWTVLAHKRFETSVQLTLGCGKHRIDVPVAICATGPILWETGLECVRQAPTQAKLRLRSSTTFGGPDF